MKERSLKISSSEIDALLREPDGLQGLARELGQYDESTASPEDEADDNHHVSLWRLILTNLGWRTD